MNAFAGQDVFELTCALMQCASVTPDDAGCQELIAARLGRAGFRIEHVEQRYVKGPRPWTWTTIGHAVRLDQDEREIP